MSKSNPLKIIVGLSGGVDSSVAALLLKQQGYHVEGLFMRNWEEEGDVSNCSADQDLIDAQAVCFKLGIRLHTVNFAMAYWDHVFTHFLAEYKRGRTPNPDVLCNKEIKFKAFLDYALDLGADYIATGHYVRCQKSNGHFQLLKGLDSDKDQSYFLYLLTEAQLSRALFPVGGLTKTEVREIAKKQGFKNYSKKSSTGICFIGERKFKSFLSRYLPAKPGDIETDVGEVIGRHDGLMYYTVGQRQGLGIGGRRDAEETPWYVLGKDLSRNVLIVGQGENHPMLFSKQLSITDVHWINDWWMKTPFRCQAKIRYRQKDQSCIIDRYAEDKVSVIFDKPQRAVALGQSIVFYLGEVCLGGGIIDGVT